MRNTLQHKVFPLAGTLYRDPLPGPFTDMRLLHFKSILLGALIWCGCDQNLRPLPDDGGQASGRSFVEAQRPIDGSGVAGRSFEEGQPTAVPADGASVSGTIDITPELFARLRGSETMYVMARRSENGPPMAVKRFRSLRFPMPYTLSGADQAVQGPPFSGEVTIVARIDLDGNAGVPQAGDMEGVNPRVVVGDSGADVVIDRLY